MHTFFFSLICLSLTSSTRLPIVDLNWWYHKTEGADIRQQDYGEWESSIEESAKSRFLEDVLKINVTQTRDFRYRKPPLYLRNIYNSLNRLSTETNLNNFNQNQSSVQIRGIWPTKVISTNDTSQLIFTDFLKTDSQIDQAELILRPKSRKLRAKFVNDTSRYQILDVTRDINKWLQTNRDLAPFTLKVSLEWNGFQPLTSHRVFLVLYYGINQLELISSNKNTQTQRLYRFPRDVETNVSSEKCQLHDWFVDFEDLGWNTWVLAPSGFQANICSGECPSILMQPEYHASNHAMLRGLYRASQSEENAEKVKPACCVPTSLRSTNLMYTEGSGIVIQRLENIIAEQCGCQ